MIMIAIGRHSVAARFRRRRSIRAFHSSPESMTPWKTVEEETFTPIAIHQFRNQNSRLRGRYRQAWAPMASATTHPMISTATHSLPGKQSSSFNRWQTKSNTIKMWIQLSNNNYMRTISKKSLILIYGREPSSGAYQNPKENPIWSK